jgi:hypothetical protein
MSQALKCKIQRHEGLPSIPNCLGLPSIPAEAIQRITPTGTGYSISLVEVAYYII